MGTLYRAFYCVWIFYASVLEYYQLQAITSSDLTKQVVTFYITEVLLWSFHLDYKMVAFMPNLTFTRSRLERVGVGKQLRLSSPVSLEQSLPITPRRVYPNSLAELSTSNHPLKEQQERNSFRWSNSGVGQHTSKHSTGCRVSAQYTLAILCECASVCVHVGLVLCSSA